MKIMTLYQSQLNKIKPGFGTDIIKYTPFYESSSYTMIHQSSVTDMFNDSSFKHANELNILIQFLNISGYVACQILKEKEELKNFGS